MPQWLERALWVSLNPLVLGLVWIAGKTLWNAAKDWRLKSARGAPSWQSPSPPEAPVERYGDRHKAERAKYRDVIRSHGGICMERDCIMPSRRIDTGAYWELGHDHQRGGATDYLGPVHQECNQAEALRRGVTWEGAPTLAELLVRVKVPNAHKPRPWEPPVPTSAASDTDDRWPTPPAEGDDDPESRRDHDPWAPPRTGWPEAPL